jgi:hypothetical protein
MTVAHPMARGYAVDPAQTETPAVFAIAVARPAWVTDTLFGSPDDQKGAGAPYSTVAVSGTLSPTASVVVAGVTGGAVVPGELAEVMLSTALLPVHADAAIAATASRVTRGHERGMLINL